MFYKVNIDYLSDDELNDMRNDTVTSVELESGYENNGVLILCM